MRRVGKPLSPPRWRSRALKEPPPALEEPADESSIVWEEPVSAFNVAFSFWELQGIVWEESVSACEEPVLACEEPAPAFDEAFSSCDEPDRVWEEAVPARKEPVWAWEEPVRDWKKPVLTREEPAPAARLRLLQIVIRLWLTKLRGVLPISQILKSSSALICLKTGEGGNFLRKIIRKSFQSTKPKEVA